MMKMKQKNGTTLNKQLNTYIDESKDQTKTMKGLRNGMENTTRVNAEQG